MLVTPLAKLRETARGLELIQELRSLGAAKFCTDRLFEWVVSIMMLCISITLAMPGDTLERSALVPLVRAGLTEESLSAFFGIVGTLRCMALFANGRLKPSGARFRAVGAAFGAVIWMQLAVILAVDSIASSKPSFVLPILLCLTGGEFISCYRSIFDAGRRSV